MKMLNRNGLSMDPWGTPLFTGLQLDFVSLITILWASLFSQFSTDLIPHPALTPTADL